jgi:hypothetical protein
MASRFGTHTNFWLLAGLSLQSDGPFSKNLFQSKCAFITKQTITITIRAKSSYDKSL